MRYIIKFDGEEIGAVTTNRSMTDEQICEAAGVELAITEEDFAGMPENGKYDLDELEIVEEARDYIGVRWGDLTEEEQEELLKYANIDGFDGNPTETRDCIVDLTETYSVEGRVIVTDEDTEIIIDDNAIIYNPVCGK